MQVESMTIEVLTLSHNRNLRNGEKKLPAGILPEIT
jgi:hypothetical protein